MYYFLCLAYNNLIPEVGRGGKNIDKRKRYLTQISGSAPPFLAFIQQYGLEYGIDKHIENNHVGGGSSMCSGSLINSQYVLT